MTSHMEKTEPNLENGDQPDHEAETRQSRLPDHEVNIDIQNTTTKEANAYFQYRLSGMARMIPQIRTTGHRG